MSRTTKKIAFARPSLGREEEEAVLRVMRSGWLTSGMESEAFEREFAEFAGVPHAVTLNSATAGLHLGLEAVGVAAGDYVAMSPYTFAASAEVTRYLGAHPLFVDIDPDTLNICPKSLEHALRSAPGRIAAVMPIHIAGLPCSLHELNAVIAEQGLAMIEDAAHVVPIPNEQAPRAGRFGTAGVFSFYANKPITTGEGGMLCTHNAELAERVRIMRLHGIDRHVFDRYRSVGSTWRYDVVEAGYKYNMPDTAAAIGRVQLRRSEDLRRRRVALATAYQQDLSDRDYLKLPTITGNHSQHLYILRIVPDLLRISRDEFIIALNERGIGTSVHYIPLHLMQYYRTMYGLQPKDFPHALQAFETAISLPLYPDLTDEERERVVQAVCEIGDAAYRGKGV